MISNYLPLNFREHNTSSKGDVGSYLDISSRTFQIMQDKIIDNSIKKYTPDVIIVNKMFHNDTLALFRG